MKGIHTTSKPVRFGFFEIDLQASELRKNGHTIKLQLQPCQILGILLERPGELVTREQLRQRLWPTDTFVDFDHSLNTAVMRLREALGDSPENPRFIQTLPRRGYRFIADVEEAGSSKLQQNTAALSSHLADYQQEAQPVSESGTANPPISGTIAPKLARAYWTGNRPALAAVALALLLGLVFYQFNKRSSAKVEPGQIESLVVLPLENLSGDKEQEYFADGMTDELTASLAKIRALRVMSRTSAMAYKGARKPLSQIARELNVDAVVEGTVLRSGNRVRITAELVQASTDRHLWAETYESDLGDVLTLQSRVARAIANEIRITLTPDEQIQLAKTGPVNPEAHEDYLRGRYYWNRRSKEGLTKAIEYFQQAVKKDPGYALPHAGAADCYAVLAATIVGAVPSKDVAPQAKAEALKAIELDDTLAEAYTALATIKFNYDWDWVAAESGFKRALELNPNYATAHQRYSLYLMAMGRTEESVAEITRARDLDPLSPSINFSLGWRLYMARQFDQAIVQLRHTIDIDPDFALAHLALGQAYEQKGLPEQAIGELQKATTLSNNMPLMASGLARAYALAGRKNEAIGVLNQMRSKSKSQYVSPFYTALVYLGMGEKEKAMNSLEQAYRDSSNGLVFLKVDPELDSLRPEPHFQDLLHRIGLPH